MSLLFGDLLHVGPALFDFESGAFAKDTVGDRCNSRTGEDANRFSLKSTPLAMLRPLDDAWSMV